MALKPIKKKRLFEEIILALEEYIQEARIEPGGKLPSAQELAQLFDVSKTAIREAISVLHSNGIIESRPGVGIFLKTLEGETIAQRVTKNLLDRRELLEILEFRRGMEVEAASLAALRASEEELSTIENAHLSLIAANEAGLVGVEEDYHFHQSIITASGNSIYIHVFEELSGKLREEISISKMQSAKIPGRFGVIHDEHEEIVQAVRQRDPEKAPEAMRRHLVNTEKKIWSYLH